MATPMRCETTVGPSVIDLEQVNTGERLVLNSCHEFRSNRTHIMTLTTPSQAMTFQVWGDEVQASPRR